MFHCLSGNTGDVVCADMTNTAWFISKMAIESVMAQLDSQVRFGFTTIYGTSPAGGGMCSSLQGTLTDNIAPVPNNAATIASLYDGLPFPPNSTQLGVKFEAPASESMGNVARVLLADTDPGRKYVLFITDRQPDYCDDSNSLCAPDSVIWKLQTAYAAGIPTIVFGVQTVLFDLAPGVLQAYANAGAGEPTNAPVKTGGSTFDFYDQCDGVAGWAADLTASGKPSARGSTLGNYSPTMGATTPYTPSASSESKLVSQLKALTCSYSIPPAMTGSIDFGKVNVQLTSGVGTVATIGYRTSADACSGGGWYYDVAPSAGTPTQIVLCPSTCSNLQVDTSGQAQIVFGCTTIQSAALQASLQSGDQWRTAPGSVMYLGGRRNHTTSSRRRRGRAADREPQSDGAWARCSRCIAHARADALPIE
jgi:hypothetical protein